MTEQLSIFNDDDDRFETIPFAERFPKLTRRIGKLKSNHITLSNPTGSTPVHDSLDLVVRSVSIASTPDWAVGDSIKRMQPKAYDFFDSLHHLLVTNQMENYGEAKELERLFGEATPEPEVYDTDFFIEELAGLVSVNEIDALLGMTAEKVAKIMYEAIEPYVNEKAGE